MEVASLIVRVGQEGVNEQIAALDRLYASGLKAEKMTLDLRAAGESQAASSRAVASQNQASGESFGMLALKVAGYSTAMGLAVDIGRRAISGIKDLGVEAITLAGNFERSRVAWGVFLKDVEAGSQMFDQIYSLAQRTPLSFQGTEQAAQMLKGFGLSVEEIIPTLERMGDVARGNDETMQRLALAYGQALAQGKVLTRDLYQFVNAGVPIFDALGSVMGKSVEQVQQLVTDGKVGFPEIEAALKSLTGQGGQFEGMMEKTAQTLEGKASIAADNFKAILASIGETTIPTLKNSLDELNGSMDAFLIKTNAALYLKTGKGDPEGIKKSLQALMDRNTEFAANNPGTKLTGLNWNIFHTAPDDGGWQPLYSPLYENQYLKTLIDSVTAQQAESGYGKAEANRQNYRPPANTTTVIDGLTADERAWRQTFKDASGIDALARPWEKTKQGTMVPGDYLTGEALMKSWFASKGFGALDTTQGDDTGDMARLRENFTKSGKKLLNDLYDSGLFKASDGSISILAAYLEKYGTKKIDLYSGSDFAMGPKGGQSALPPPGDWSGTLSIAAQMAAMDSFWMPGIEADNEKQADQYRKAMTAARYNAFGWNFSTSFKDTKVPALGESRDIFGKYTFPAAYNPTDPETGARYQGQYEKYMLGLAATTGKNFINDGKVGNLGSPEMIAASETLAELEASRIRENRLGDYYPEEYGPIVPDPAMFLEFQASHPSGEGRTSSNQFTLDNLLRDGMSFEEYLAWQNDRYATRRDQGLVPTADEERTRILAARGVSTESTFTPGETLFGESHPMMSGYTQNANAAADLEKQRKAADDLAEAYKRMGDAMKGALESTVIDGFKSIGEALAGNKGAADDFGSALSNTIGSLLNQLPMLMLEAGLSAMIHPDTFYAGLALVAGSGLVAVGAGAYNYATSGESATTPSVDVGAFARGTDFAPGGWAIVGEKGPELRYIPRGSTIIPNNRIADFAPSLGIPGFASGLNVPSVGGTKVYLINNAKNTEVQSEESIDPLTGDKTITYMVESVVKKMASSGKLQGLAGTRRAATARG